MYLDAPDATRFAGLQRYLRGWFTLLAFTSVVLASAAPAPSRKEAKPAGPAPLEPSLRIPIAALGFAPPSSAYLMYRLSSNTLDFIDNTHILFTFREAGLLTRLPSEPEDDHDQVIRAVVLALPGGEITASAEWRMHDRARYLWPLTVGRFLLRQRDSLFLTGPSLKLEPYINVETHLQSITVSPDRKLLVIQADAERHSPEEHKTLTDQAKAIGASPPKEDVKLVIINVADRTVLARSTAPRPVEFPVVQQGYIETISAKSDNHWMLRYVPFSGEMRVLGEVASSCQPTIRFLNSETILLNVCKDRAPEEHQIEAFSFEGKVLWQQRWDSRYVWPTFAYAENGTRYAYSSLQLTHSIGSLEPVDDDLVQAEVVGAFDTPTGQLRIVKNATPVSSAGQNFALSADASRFAILREGTIEVYDLPPLTPPAAPAVSPPAPPTAHP